MNTASKVLVCGWIIGACVTIRAQNQTISKLSGENRRLVTKHNRLVTEHNALCRKADQMQIALEAVAEERRSGRYQPPHEEVDVFEVARKKRENLYR